MRFCNYIPQVLAALSLPFCGVTGSASRFTSPQYHQQILDNFLNVWGGDYSLLNKTFAPDVIVYADRFPSPTGEGSAVSDIQGSQAYLEFIQRARNGWTEYKFEVFRWTSRDFDVAVRWKMEGIMGENFTLAPTTLKPGDNVTYNGTDFLVLDEKTGLIKEDNVAQDLITLFHNLGLTAVTV